MSEKEKLKFSIRVERKVTTKQYESATVGFWKEFYQDETLEDAAFKYVKSVVDGWVEKVKP